MSKKLSEKKLVAKNKKAYFDYEILDTFEAGIVLSGAEVKSIRNGRANLKGAFVGERQNELVLEKMHIAAYQILNQHDYDEYRRRKLLVNKKEKAKIIGSLEAKGIAVIPLEVYFKKNFVKILIGIGKGKKKYDKRETIKKREEERQLRLGFAGR